MQRFCPGKAINLLPLPKSSESREIEATNNHILGLLHSLEERLSYFITCRCYARNFSPHWFAGFFWREERSTRSFTWGRLSRREPNRDGRYHKKAYRITSEVLLRNAGLIRGHFKHSPALIRLSEKKIVLSGPSLKIPRNKISFKPEKRTKFCRETLVWWERISSIVQRWYVYQKKKIVLSGPSLKIPRNKISFKPEKRTKFCWETLVWWEGISSIVKRWYVYQKKNWPFFPDQAWKFPVTR